MKAWKKEALRLHREGVSWRGIAKKLGKGKSSVSDFLRKETKGYVRPSDSTYALSWGKGGGNTISPLEYAVNASEGYKPNILLIDVETAPMTGAIWSLWRNNVGLNQIQKDWHFLSYCAKWYGEDEVFYRDQKGVENISDDREILKEIYALLEKSDFVVGHNLNGFDDKRINSRLIINGFPKPSPYRRIDTLDIVKRNFGFTSNKLEYLTNLLCVDNKKLKHERYPGYELWAECLKGNEDAFDEMMRYNVMDVLSLEELLTILAPWDNRLPSLDVYNAEHINPEDWEEDGYAYTNLSKFQRYRNIHTGQYKRGRTNLLTKEQRQKLLANII